MFRMSRIGAVAVVALFAITVLAQEKPHAKVVTLTRSGAHDTLLFAGPPETVTMKSGLVILPPGRSVGKRSTGSHEEMLVILEGRGAMTFTDGKRLEVDPDHITLLPAADRA